VSASSEAAMSRVMAWARCAWPSNRAASVAISWDISP
jgi:hypothetical protein